LINPQTGSLVREAEYIFETWFNKYSIPASEIDDFDEEKSTKADRYMTKQTACHFLQNAMQDNHRNNVGTVKKLTPDDTRIA
jgi:hypothetical protein